MDTSCLEIRFAVQTSGKQSEMMDEKISKIIPNMNTKTTVRAFSRKKKEIADNTIWTWP